MSYRDELDAARARIEALERELSETKQQLGQSTALVRATEQSLARRDGPPNAAERWLGDSTRLEAERTIEGSAPTSCYVEVVDFLARHFDTAGRTATLEGRLEWTSVTEGKGVGPFVTVTITANRGQTVIRVTENLASLAGALFGGVGGGVGGGGVMVPGSLFFVNPVLGAVAMPIWFGGVYWLCRAIYKNRVKKRRRRFAEAVERIVAIVEQAIEAPVGREGTPADMDRE